MAVPGAPAAAALSGLPRLAQATGSGPGPGLLAGAAAGFYRPHAVAGDQPSPQRPGAALRGARDCTASSNHRSLAGSGQALAPDPKQPGAGGLGAAACPLQR